MIESNDVISFQKLSAKLDTLRKEYVILSKSKPNDPINKFKLKIINQTLEGVAELIGENLLPIKDFTKFEEDSLPSYSDVLMVISSYLDGMEDFRCLNIYKEGFEWRWRTKDSTTYFLTSGPTRFNKLNNY